MLKVLSIVARVYLPASLIALNEQAGNIRDGLLMKMCRSSPRRTLFGLSITRNRLIQRILSASPVQNLRSLEHPIDDTNARVQSVLGA